MHLRVIQDALERDLEVPPRPLRIVSLVPSVTELLFDLGAGDRVVGVSAYCSEPVGGLDGVARVGGQKDPHLAKIVALAPDLVLAVKEENRERDVAALTARGVAVYVADVRDVEDAAALVGEIGDLVDGAPMRVEALGREVVAGVVEARRIAATHAPVSVFCPVWRDPWIGISSDTYMFDVLETCGGAPVRAGARERNDRRYPKLDLAAVAAVHPEVVLLPDEPYAFGARDAAELSALLPRARVVIVDGKSLLWYGRRTGGIAAIARILAG